MRNDAPHDKNVAPVEATRGFLQSYMASLNQIRFDKGYEMLKGKGVVRPDGLVAQPQRAAREQESSPWPPPPEGRLAVSLDGSFDANTHTAGAAMVARNSRGEHIFSACWFIQHCSSALEAECVAAREGISAALQLTTLPLIVQTDCASLVKAVESPETDKSIVGHLVMEIKEMMRERELVIRLVGRLQNRTADRLAYMSRVEHITDLWLHVPPAALVSYLASDCTTIP